MSTLGKFQNALPVTPSDSAGLNFPSRAISIGAAGAVAVDMYGGQKNVTITLSAGMFELAVTKVYSTGTTATGIAVYW
jgi:hypothetical protein